MTYAFISYSRRDEKVADALIEKLGKERVFIDKFDLDVASLLPSRLAEGIAGSNWFVLIASSNSMKAKWVKYEVSLAVINWIEKQNFSIIVVRIDDCEILPELKPFVYIDCPNDPEEAIEKTVDFILSEGKGRISRQREWKRKVVNRYNEISAIENLAHEKIPFIFFWGLFGIGKTTLAEYAARQVFNSKFLRFPLTSGHDYLRLALELAVNAKEDLPPPSASENELLKSTVNSIVQLTKQGYVILFDDLENTLEDDRSIPKYLSDILNELTKIDLDIPLLFSSSLRPETNANLIIHSHIMKIDRLGDKHTLYCLENWIQLSDPAIKNIDRASLESIVPRLFGYPLAARLASYIITRYSLSLVLEDTRYFNYINLAVAKQLLGRVQSKLTNLELQCLEALTVADTGLSLQELSEVLGVDIDEVRTSIDNLVSSLFVFSEKGRLQIIPIVKDYFWAHSTKTENWKKLAEKLAKEAKFKLGEVDIGGEEYVHYSSMEYRLLTLLGRRDETTRMKYQYEGELRGAVIRLYRVREYKLALEYATLWLQIKNNDNQIRWYRARCLTRLEDYNGAKKELEHLKKANFVPYKLNFAWGLLYREMGNLEKAIAYFLHGLDDRPDYIPLLRELGDAYQRLDDLSNAIKYLKQAYENAPRDPYVLPKLADVLEKLGKYEEAISIMEGASVAFPEEAIYKHKISVLLSNLGRYDEAYTHAKIAVELNPKLEEAVVHLASLEIKRGNIKEAKRLLEILPRELSFRKSLIRNTVYSEIALKEKDYLRARSLINRYDYTKDPFLADILGRIALAEALEAIGKRQMEIACDCLKKGKEIMQVAIAKFPKNQPPKNTLEEINKLIIQLC